MPLPARVSAQAVTVRLSPHGSEAAARPLPRIAIFALVVATVVLAGHERTLTAQGDDATEARLRTASRGRVIRVGSATGSRPVMTLPLEGYVARVLAGEGEPNAADGARQALAVAIRTFALVNLQRHRRDGYDLCDSTHCQVPRADNPTTRNVALATAGLVLTHMGKPAELFYSASCGGFSESAEQVWPGVDRPYLQVAPDDVHEADTPWVTTLPMEQIENSLLRAGFEGRLRDIAIDQRNASGRVARLRLDGLTPSEIRGNEFRGAVGFTTLRSTAFALERTAGGFQFTGRGFGHGVGMCVIGAGRRAARGESLQAILAHYYPGLQLTRLDANK